MKIIKSTIILFVAVPAMAVYALYEAINALAIEIDLVRIRAMTNCCRKFYVTISRLPSGGRLFLLRKSIDEDCERHTIRDER